MRYLKLSLNISAGQAVFVRFYTALQLETILEHAGRTLEKFSATHGVEVTVLHENLGEAPAGAPVIDVNDGLTRVCAEVDRLAGLCWHELNELQNV